MAKKVTTTTVPAPTKPRKAKLYASTLAAIAVPALVAGIVTAFMFAGPQKDASRTTNVAELAELIRAGQAKQAQASALATSLEVRTSAVHAPVDDAVELLR